MFKLLPLLVATACSFAALFCAAAPAAHACTGIPRSAMNFTQQPADGGSAPANARIWVPLGNSFEGFGPLTLFTNGVEVATDAKYISVDGEGFQFVLGVLTPRQAMSVGATMELRLSGTTLSFFTVTAAIPGGTEGPTATRIDIQGGYYGGHSCPTRATVSVRATPADQLLLLLDRSEQYTDLPSKIRGISLGAASALLVDEGAQRFDIVSVNAAGQLSPRTELDEITVPSETTGCRAAGRGTAPSLLLILMIPLLVLRRRAR
jgi:hypothetical protein